MVMEPRKRRGVPEGKQIPEVESTNLVPIKGGDPVEVLTADETYANSVHLRIMALLKQYEETYFELARSLFEVSARKLYRSMDSKYPSFEKYVEEAVGIDFRKAKYLVSIWWWFGIEQRADPALLRGAQEIGWSRAKELVGVVDKKNAEVWFEIARTKKRDFLVQAAKAALKKAGRKRRRTAPESVFQGEFEFAEESQNLQPPTVVDEEGAQDQETTMLPDETPAGMKTLSPEPPKGMRMDGPSPPSGIDTSDGSGTKASTETLPLEGVAPPEDVVGAVADEKSESDKWTRVYFDLHEDFKKTVEVALSNAKRIGETEHAGYALSLVCLHYLSFYSEKWSVEIGEWLHRIEAVTGFTIFAMNERTDEIIYGQDLLDRIVASEEKDDAGESGIGDAGDGVGEEGVGGVDPGDEGSEGAEPGGE